MKRLTKMFKGGQKGFTLIELLIVIVILGVLAAAIIPNLSKFTNSGKVGAANAELATVRTAVAAYQSTNDGNYPTVALAQPTAASAIYVATYQVDEALIILFISASQDIVGLYSVDNTGYVVGKTPYEGNTNITWDATSHKWK